MPQHLNRVALALGCLAAGASADVITDWNNVYLDTIREVGGPPCPLSRAGAMVHVAMYDAVNSIERTHQAYLTSLDVPETTSRVAAAAAAAHRVLVALYPDRADVYDAALKASLASVPDGVDKDNGVTLGVDVADSILAARAADGTQEDPIYVFGDEPGDYVPTFPDFTEPPFSPGWGESTPWTMVDDEQFRIFDGPAGYTVMSELLASVAYAANVNEVQLMGSLNSKARTEYETKTAFFWANDVNGTYKPPGHLNSISQVVSANHGLSLAENARLFALINLAMADAGLVAWDSKYDTDIDLWRPISAIRGADTDGNAATHVDPDWVALNPFSPSFPAWMSGHSTFGAAHAAVMAYFFGTDEVTFTIDSEDPFYQDLGGGLRTYHRFSDAAWENAESRVFLGVHYRFDCEDGNEAGTLLGQYVGSKMLLPACHPDWNGDGSLDVLDFVAFIEDLKGQSLHADLNGDGDVNILDAVKFQVVFQAGCG